VQISRPLKEAKTLGGTTKIYRDNPYPPESPYHGLWRQGWQAENDLQHK
jgi:hypothetical protein